MSRTDGRARGAQSSPFPLFSQVPVWGERCSGKGQGGPWRRSHSSPPSWAGGPALPRSRRHASRLPAGQRVQRGLGPRAPRSRGRLPAPQGRTSLPRAGSFRGEGKAPGVGVAPRSAVGTAGGQGLRPTREARGHTPGLRGPPALRRATRPSRVCAQGEAAAGPLKGRELRRAPLRVRGAPCRT